VQCLYGETRGSDSVGPLILLMGFTFEMLMWLPLERPENETMSGVYVAHLHTGMKAAMCACRKIDFHRINLISLWNGRTAGVTQMEEKYILQEKLKLLSKRDRTSRGNVRYTLETTKHVPCGIPYPAFRKHCTESPSHVSVQRHQPSEVIFFSAFSHLIVM
jgi:hypothetical protein